MVWTKQTQNVQNANTNMLRWNVFLVTLFSPNTFRCLGELSLTVKARLNGFNISFNVRSTVIKLNFSNSLIIHEEKTKEIITV